MVLRSILKTSPVALISTAAVRALAAIVSGLPRGEPLRPLTAALPHLLAPKAVAVVGASQRGGRGSNVSANLRDCGFAGGIFAVNPRYQEILGYSCVPSVRDLPAACSFFRVRPSTCSENHLPNWENRPDRYEARNYFSDWAQSQPGLSGHLASDRPARDIRAAHLGRFAILLRE